MNKNYTAIDLLDKVLEFIAMTPDQKEWEVKKLKYNKPRQLRLQQIEALLTAFGLHEKKVPKGIFSTKPSVGKAINNLLLGDFIMDFNERQIGQIDDYITNHLNNPNFNRKLAGGEVQFIYQHAIKYRKLVTKIRGFNSGWLEAGGKMAQYAISITSTSIDNLEGKTEELNEVLTLIINPSQLAFTEQELIERFQYPDVDLLAIDNDFL